MSDDNFYENIDNDIEDELVAEYIKSLKEGLLILEENINKQDFDSIRTYGHKLSGSGGTYGFGILSDIGSKIEDAAEVKDLDSIKKFFEKLCGEIEKLG
ncbi:Hpt domain-containing protein [candidate division KSB1 bacterium]